MSWTEIVAVTGLAWAAWHDHRTRTVPNRIWLLMLAALAPVLAWELATQPVAAGIRLAVAAAWAGAMYLLWRGQVFGGADAKGLMVLGLALGPVGYYAPEDGQFLAAFDTLPLALLASEAWRRISGQRTTAFFLVLLPALLLTLRYGGLLWLPIAWLVRTVIPGG